jgi:hypothetical protein
MNGKKAKTKNGKKKNGKLNHELFFYYFSFRKFCGKPVTNFIDKPMRKLLFFS